jgi:hypothetical protein
LKNSNAEPLKVFVPDLVVTVIAAPAAIPCSASMLPVISSVMSTRLICPTVTGTPVRTVSRKPWSAILTS